MKYHGKDLILQIDTGSGFVRVESQRSTSVTINQEFADITDKDGNLWREGLQAAGVTASQIVASGIVTDGSVYQYLFAAKMARQHVLARIVGGIIDYTAYFSITALSSSGEHNGVEVFDLALDHAEILAVGNAWQWDSGDDVLWDGGDMVLLESA